MTYGQLRLRLSKLAAGVDRELIDGWIQDRYTQILDQLPWKRLEGETVIQSPASYQVGTLSVSQGSANVVGAGTAWTSAMTGLMIRIANGPEFYIFTYASAEGGTLDRPYEEPDAAGAAYRIDQSIFTLPLDCRVLRAVRGFHPSRELELISPAELNRLAPGRHRYGVPRFAAHTWDANTDPPLMQIELYPIPDSPDPLSNTLSFAVDYIYDPGDIDPSQTSASLLPWVRPAALIKGVQADAALWQEKLTLAQGYESTFEKLVKQMAMINALQRGPQALRLAPELRGRGTPVGYHRAKHAERDYFGEDDF